ncbi:MAG: relaxase/mobilization nuclease domain-containing protein [Oscillospiraceae bacterium]|nr:relaxase/mobilization nuclease domain-containing protein [Oscillospiraceae bacterium]
MATTKIWPVRDNLARVVEYAENHLKTANPNTYTARELADLRNVLDYAENTDKTAKQFYVTGVNCIGEYAYRQMLATKQRFGKTGGNLAYHAYQSFAHDEVTPRQCHEIGVQLAKTLWGNRYEVLVTTHLNTNCLHNHLVVNSVSFVDGKKLDNNYAMYFKNLRAESDRLCREHGLSVIEYPKKSSGSRWMQQTERRGEPTLYNVVRSDIDSAIRQSMTDAQFYRLLRQWGYSVNDDPKRKYATIRALGMKHNIRFKTLGESYTPQAIVQRILENQRPELPPPVRIQTQRYQLRGSFKTARKFSGLYAKYLHYCYLLGVIPKNRQNPKKPLSPELCTAVRMVRKFSEQTRLLCRHKIETEEQLTSFVDSRKEDLSDLGRQRGRVYNRMKSAKTPEALDSLKSERDELTGKIKTIRHELFYARDILARSADIDRQIRVELRLRAERFRLGQSKQLQQKERGIAR